MEIYDADPFPTIRFYGVQECPIATPVLNKSYGPMRDDIAK
jgi:hypothetical protein